MRRRFFEVLSAIALFSTLFGGCTSSETSVTAPTADNKCQVTARLSSSTFTADGGSGTVAISTARDCTWSVSTSSNWVTVSGAASGQGDASVAYVVAANTVASARSGSISVAGVTMPLSQAAAPCRFSLSQTQSAISAAGGPLSVAVTTLSGCGWNATPGASWISVTSGQSGNAPGMVGLSVAANAGPQRVGQVNIAGQNYTITQAGTPTPSPIPPTPPPPSPGPGPAPTPPPPQPPGPTVQVTGVVWNVSGKCPNVSMMVGLRQVQADKSTRFKGLKCDGLDTGRVVVVTGTEDSAGVIQADQIEQFNADGT
jgi:hypothetical protein